ncbi:BcsR/BcsP family cellulose biosynthesis protein [Limnobacter sp.]|uniref:BcsR/BcsP family cellulose biosynthesis protein n=1 Tax=Limnobacter sp. TaxID=2003368 RepID=UPI003516A064
MAEFDPQSPPAMFLPPADLAHDIYALSAQLEGFDHHMYQDIQQDQAVYDSLQRWPFLFNVTVASTSSEGQNSA